MGALNELGVEDSAHWQVVPDSIAGDGFALQIGDQVLIADITSVVTAGGAEQIIRMSKLGSSPVIVIADRIAEEARSAFRRAGINFFDRRGELRLILSPLIIDARVSGRMGTTAGPDVLSSQVAKETAIACLVTPDRPHRVREIAAFVGRAPSAVSNAMAGLRSAGLLTSAGEPLVPDLFQELSVRWRRKPIALAALPSAGQRRVTDHLDLGLEQVESTIGWALTDTLGAAAWGMPIVAQGDYPPDFYVPTSAVLHRAAALLGAAPDSDGRACTVAVAPVRLACLHRHDLQSELWPVANHIVVALDIATDRARGAEVLDQWNPEHIVRGW